MEPLTPPDSHFLAAAQGWLELGDPLEADRELEKIAPSLRAHPDVLEIRWHVYAGEKKWAACVDIGLGIMKGAPHRAEGWIHRSFALHAPKRTREAYTNLACVAEKFPGNWSIPYNLACYCSQLGRLQEAQDWFKKAVVIDDKIVPKTAINDPDLKPLWDSMSTTNWKKNE